MGLGAFHLLYAMKGFRYITLAVQWGTVGLCALFLVLCTYDFIVYQRTKNPKKCCYSCPKAIKNTSIK